MSLTVSFWQQNQNARASAAAANDRLDAANAAAAKLFSAGTSATQPASVLTDPSSNSNSIINSFGQIFLNASMNAAVLAAQEGNDRVNAQTSKLNTSTKRPAGDLSSQVTFQGSLGLNFVLSTRA